jgi:RHS repeat-associated protein
VSPQLLCRAALPAWILLAVAAPLHAGVCDTNSPTCSGPITVTETGNGSTSGGLCFTGTIRCSPPVIGNVTYAKTSPTCDPLAGPCAMTATIPVEFKRNSQNFCDANSVLAAGLFYVNGGLQGQCGDAPWTINTDFATFTVSRSVSCSDTSTYLFEAAMCGHGLCGEQSSVPLDFAGSGASGCPIPLPFACSEPGGGPGGEGGMSCHARHQGGGDGGCSVCDGNLACTPAGAGKSQLRYAAGGVGGDGLPGTAAWRTTLGRFWSHDYAERIVVDPDTPAPGHVWFLTRYGSFREYFNLAAGSGLRQYQSHAPSDEFRKLFFDTATSGWQLQTLDGRTDYFLSDGRWDKTVMAQDPGHPTQGTYNGSNQLISVSFPDGRGDSFTYNASGKLETITTVPVAGSGTSPRTWTLTWSGDELATVARPDGTTWQFVYDPTRPGYMTRMDLVSGPDARVMAAFSYLAGTNRVEKSWRGDPLFTGPNAVDKMSIAYTNPTLPTQEVVTRTVSGSFDQVTTYAIARDTVSIKPKVTSIQGTCPTCGLSPTTTFAYTGSNPLLPSSMTDAKGTRTDFTYNSNGRTLTRVEAANVPALSRTTSFSYGETNFPGLVTKIEVPSTSGGANKRSTSFDFDDTTGRLLSQTIDGFEAGVALPAGYKTTSYTPNTSGEMTSIDPPGFGTADATTFTYNLAGRNGHVADSRSIPNPPGAAMTTTFGYDGLNRRTSVVGPNGVDPNRVEIATAYDPLDRVLEVRNKGATPADTTDDLVTSYTYNVFKDLFCTKLPNGNGIEYDYDTARRLVAVVRGMAVAVPSSTSCLDVAQPRERTAYQLDIAGNRSEESRERWNAGTSTWDSESKTAYVYTCHLDKATQGAGSATTTVTEYCHDLNDNLEKVWDGNHPKVSNPSTPTQFYEYDELNRLKKVTVGVGPANAAATSYTYDVQDHLATVADAEGNLSTYTTSDRDLLTKEISPVFSGATNFTTHEYDEHGVLKKTVDPRAIETVRTVDAASRVTQETYGPSGAPDTSLTVTYAYGSTPAQFDVGRMIGITRNSQTVGYTYDPFGRMLQDGPLVYAYDKNGNRTGIANPGGTVSATYTFDALDRPSGLTYDAGSGAQTLVSQVSYRALGPLASLKLGTSPGLVETRTWDSRNFIDRIQAGTLMDWDYTLDGIGNPTAISGTINGVAFAPTFSYQDSLYFLTQTDGPWGNRTWTYDKIGNRSSFARTSEPTQTYGYTSHNPKLQSVTPAPGWGTGSWSYTYDTAGNQTQLLESNDEGAVQTSFFDVAADGRMSTLRTSTAPMQTAMLYDGRGLLRQAAATVSPPGDFITETPVYSSDGTLYARTEDRRWSGGTGGDGEDDPTFVTTSTDVVDLFYFAGRPVAQLTNESDLLYLTTDHLGTPVLATTSSGATVWAGALEPFGQTWTAGADNADGQAFSGGAERRRFAAPGKRTTPPGVFGTPGPPATPKLSPEVVFLRYPGQWVSDAFRVTGTQQDVYYNVHRWYEPQTGRYSQRDPLWDPFRRSVLGPRYQPNVPQVEFAAIVANFEGNHYAYVDQDPVGFSDPLGLQRANCQNRGCDMVPDFLENRRRTACCECHDACYYTNTCGIGSWLHTIMGCLVPVVRRTPCDGCNRFVVRCFARSFIGWDTACPFAMVPPEIMHCENPEPPVIPPVPPPPPRTWGPPPVWEGPRQWGPQP